MGGMPAGGGPPGMGGGDPMGGMGGMPGMAAPTGPKPQPIPQHADVWEVLDSIMQHKPIEQEKKLEKYKAQKPEIDAQNSAPPMGGPPPGMGTGDPTGGAMPPGQPTGALLS